jgi:hypothetical protein
LELGALLGRTVTQEQGNAVLAIVTSMAKAYTRDEGFTAGVPNDELRSVILSASARLIAHPRQLGMSENLGPESASWREGFTGWTVAELFTLNRYRKRAE